MKRYLLFFFIIILFVFQKAYASDYDPVIKYFTPVDGTIINISEAETGMYVDIYFHIENLSSASGVEWCGYEIWVYIDGNQTFNFKDKHEYPRTYTYETTLNRWLSVGSHNIKIKAKSYRLEFGWVDTYLSEKTNSITIKHPFTVNISRAFEFDQTESLPSQHSSTGDPIPIQVVSTYNHPSGRQYFFAGWSDGITTNPRTVTDKLTITALYKVVNKSNDPLAFSNNSQRRLIQTKPSNNPRWLHKVYTSSIGGVSHVWLEHSSNGGSSWVLGNNSRPLSGSQGGKNPSIACSYNSGNNCDYIGVLWQQKDGSTYQIMGKMFTQFRDETKVPGNGSEVRRIYPINQGENTESYSVNANPNLILAGNGYPYYFITFETKSVSGGWQPGINWVVGQIEDAGHQHAGPFGYVQTSSKAKGIVIGNSSSTNTQISQYPDYNDIWVTLIRQQGSPGAIYSHELFLYYNGSQWVYEQTDYGMISSPILNSNPSVLFLPNTYYSACWIEYANMVFYYSQNHVLYYYGNYVESCSMNRGGGSSNSGFAVWSEYPGSNRLNRSIRFDNGIPVSSSIRTLTTSGGKYVQVGNGAHTDHSNMYACSFYPFTSPYSFNTFGTLNPLSKENPEIITGRGFRITTGDVSFNYCFGDLNADGKNISFADAPDDLDYGKIETLNSVLVTEPFSINGNSKIVFSERSGFSDSLAAVRKLGKDGFINIKVEIIDETTGKSLSQFKNITINSSNAYSDRKPAYSLNAKGLAGKTVRLKITLETNQIEQFSPQLVVGGSENIPDKIKQRLETRHSNLVLIKRFSEVNETLNESSLTELEVSDLDIPSTYALDQNYPNPFNPITVINYQIPEDGLVTLKVYDILGKEVRTLVNEAKTIGRYEVNFDATDLASGVYIYKLQAGSYSSSKKMMLIK